MAGNLLPRIYSISMECGVSVVVLMSSTLSSLLMHGGSKYLLYMNNDMPYGERESWSNKIIKSSTYLPTYLPTRTLQNLIPTLEASTSPSPIVLCCAVLCFLCTYNTYGHFHHLDSFFLPLTLALPISVLVYLFGTVVPIYILVGHYTYVDCRLLHPSSSLPPTSQTSPCNSIQDKTS